MVKLNEWSSDYFKYSTLATNLWNYLDLESEEEIIVSSRQLLQSNDVIAFGTVADVFLEPMPNSRWGQMNPYWSLKELLREKARRILLADSLVEVAEQNIDKEILTKAHHMALDLLSFIGYEEEDIEVAWRAITRYSSEPTLISNADNVILHALPYIVNISSRIRNELTDYYIRRFLEEQSPYHLNILNNLGGDSIAEILEAVFLLAEEKRVGIKNTILEEALYSPHIDISNQFRPIGQEYCDLYKLHKTNQMSNFPLKIFNPKSTQNILTALDELEVVIAQLKMRNPLKKEEMIMIVENWLTKEVFDLLHGKLHNLSFFNQLPIKAADILIYQLLDFDEEDYASILKLKGIAEALKTDNYSFSKVISKADTMIPLARALNDQNQLYPME